MDYVIVYVICVYTPVLTSEDKALMKVFTARCTMCIARY